MIACSIRNQQQPSATIQINGISLVHTAAECFSFPGARAHSSEGTSEGFGHNVQPPGKKLLLANLALIEPSQISLLRNFFAIILYVYSGDSSYIVPHYTQ
jgi:hypothetical protein